MTAFTKLLVANRAEIAVRVIETARALGYSCVAVYSDVDAGAPHVEMADEAVNIGPAPAADSYLCIDALLKAAKVTGADAVHPGYGFLAENSDFAQRCLDAGLTFVGPPPAAIAWMGDKARAKRRMIEADVPTVPGFFAPSDEEASDAQLHAQALELGCPLLVKAVAGGGGRGMRAVLEPSQLLEAIASARLEAASAFGDGAVFFERLLSGARHVEVQIFADAHGNVIHLGERDCSVQRRHQKVLEEAPCVAVDAGLRDRLGQAAVAAARAIGYVGAGTVEFLLDDAGAFYFLEMNTRLQVEHPVTEMVTGLDLVAWQLEIATGKPLPIGQGELELRGHAVEARVYAEDPYAGFLPQTGPIVRFAAPDGAGIRVDAGIATGCEVSAFYDPLLAKVVAHGRDRNEALRRLAWALRRTVVLGPVTNLDLLQELVVDPTVQAGVMKTDTLDTWFAQQPPRPATSDELWAVAAAVHVRGPGADGWRSSGQLASVLRLRCGSEDRTLRVEWQSRGASPAVLTVGGPDAALELRIVRDDGRVLRVESGGVLRSYDYASVDGTTYVSFNGRSRTFFEPDLLGAQTSEVEGIVRSPIAGTLLAVRVQEGQRVERGDLLLTIEAMKMEHRIEAPSGGVIEGLTAIQGGQVVGGQVLLILSPGPQTAREPQKKGDQPT